MTASEVIAWRVWPDGTVQEWSEQPYSHMSDDYWKVMATSEEAALHRAKIRELPAEVSGPIDELAELRAENLRLKRELQISQSATNNIAMGASIKLATARQFLLSYIQANRSSQLSISLQAVLDVLPGTQSLPPASASGAPRLEAQQPKRIER